MGTNKRRTHQDRRGGTIGLDQFEGRNSGRLKKKMIKKRGSWIRTATTISLIGGSEESYKWEIKCQVSRKGKITTEADKSILCVIDPLKTISRVMDRKWFIRHCGVEYMSNKEVDHDWKSDPIWCRVVSPMENGGRREVQSGKRRNSFVETEEWLQELYPGERR